MTVCITAVCDNGNAVVAASDRMITHLGLSIEFTHNTPKIYPLCEKCVMLSAGNALAHTKIVDVIKDKLAGKKDETIEQIANMISDVYQDLRREEVEGILLKTRGITIESFYDNYIKHFPIELVQMIDGTISNYNLGLDLIICGIDRKGAHVFGVVNPGIANCYDSLGFYAIGSGLPHASTLLAFTYEPGMSLEDMKKYLYKVKKNAEVAPGVGKETDMSVITDNGIEVINLEEIENQEGNPNA